MRWVARVSAVVAGGLLLAACSSSGKASPQHSLSSLTGKTTAITLSAAFVHGLHSLGATPSPIGKATVAMPTVTFPITGGNLAVYKPGSTTPPVQGEVDHRGSGLELTVGRGAKRKSIDLKNLMMDLTTSSMTGDVTSAGKVLFRDAGLFTLDSSKATTTATSSGVTVSGIKVELSNDAAVALKAEFKVKSSLIKGGLLAGTATIDATGAS